MMKYLIDTHILIWHGKESHRLKPSVLAEIDDLSNTVYVSHASFWGITIKLSIGKLEFSTPVSQYKEKSLLSDFKVLDIDFNHYTALEALPYYHRDPFDRMLIGPSCC